MIRFNFQLQSFACPLWIATRTPQHQLFQLLGLNHLTHPTLKVQPWTFPYGEVVRVTTTIANGDEVDCQSDYWMIEHVYIFPLVLAPPVPRVCDPRAVKHVAVHRVVISHLRCPLGLLTVSQSTDCFSLVFFGCGFLDSAEAGFPSELYVKSQKIVEFRFGC
ncbi:unnamed protein product [Somion occarium]|uniref:Uncharacterized protein n=1 Tax=Somion occarium TaxID=3059160 RepID=A0ABP1CPP9_9APHY